MSRARSSAVVLAVLVLLTGCGSAPAATSTAPPHARDLIRRMGAVMTALPGGFQVHSTLDVGGPTLTGDFRLQGDDAAGTFSIGDLRCELRRVGGHTYGKAPAQFWTSLNVSATAAAAVDGRWAVVDAVGVSSELRRSHYLGNYSTAGEGEYDGVRSAQVDGATVWQTTEIADQETFWISTGSDPRLLRRTEKAGQIDFSFPTGALQVTAPAGAVPLQ